MGFILFSSLYTIIFSIFSFLFHSFYGRHSQKVPHPPQDRTMVVACLAEVAQEMGSPISAYVDVWIDIC